MEKKFSIQSRVYAQPLNNDNYNFFLPQEAKAFPIAPPVCSDFPVCYFLSYLFPCTCVFVGNVCVGKDWEYVRRLKLALRCLSPPLHTLVFGDKVSH